MAQDEYLGVLREGVLPVASDEPEQALDQLIEERQGHGRAAWLSTLVLVKSRMGVFGPYKVPGNMTLRCTEQDNG
jgi:hypothetical protein